MWKLVYFIGIKLISISVQDLKQLICYTNSFVRIVVFTCIMSRFFFFYHRNSKNFFLFQLYICATNTKGISFFFWHLEHKINIRSHILKNVDILNNKMRLSLYIVHQSNIIVVGFFFYTVMYKFIYFFGLDSYFKSHNNNDIVCSFYHHAFHNTIFFFCVYTINFLWILLFFFFLEVDILLLEFRRKKIIWLT